MNFIDQDYIDNLVLFVADKKTDIAGIVCDCIINNDPARDELIMRLMAVQVMQLSIRDYDITWELFTEDDLFQIEETMLEIIQTCPNYA